MTVGEVSEAFREAGQTIAADKPETKNPEDRFIDLYLAPVSVPTIGRTLLGDAAYDRLAGKLKPGQSAILVAGDGAYSFKGSGYVRGGIFDRIELLQSGQGVRFRDRDHTRIPALAADGAPRLREIALYVVPSEFAFDVTQPFELQMLVQRSAEGRNKSVLPYNLSYILPDSYVTIEQQPAPAAPPPAAAPAPGAAHIPGPGSDMLTDQQIADGQPLWMRIWDMNRINIGITIAALLVLTAIFFFQDWLVKRPVLFAWVRRGYLLFGQRADLRQFADDRLQLGILPVRAADLHPVGRGCRRTAVLGPRTVLRLALPVRRAPGTDEQYRPVAEGAADPPALGAA